MKTLFILFLASIFAIAIVLQRTNSAAAHTTGDGVVIHMDASGFEPSEIEIKVGETVIFENVGEDEHWPASNIHPTHDVYPEFDPQKGIKPGDTWSFTFDAPGIWRFHDHLFAKNVGKITVVGEEKEPSWFETIIAFVKGLFGLNRDVAGVETRAFDPSIREDDETISTDDEALYSYVKKFGTRKAIDHVDALDAVAGRDCHQAAHNLGRYSYELYGEEAFASCTASCHSGCYHGATEAFFRENGTANLKEHLQVICGNDLNEFFGHQCVHGVGHGLMAWSDYAIHEALAECDLLPEKRESCYTGVFMENIVGGLAAGHNTQYLSDDPHYPCTEVAEKYRGECYFYQTSRMVELLDYNFTKVSETCLEAQESYQLLCFESMGRDVSGYTHRVPEKAIALCQSAPAGDLRSACLRGAVQDMFWDTSGQDKAIAFCTMLEDATEKSECYAMINYRASQVLLSQKERDDFCRKVEENHIGSCMVWMETL